MIAPLNLTEMDTIASMKTFIDSQEARSLPKEWVNPTLTFALRDMQVAKTGLELESMYNNNTYVGLLPSNEAFENWQESEMPKPDCFGSFWNLTEKVRGKAWTRELESEEDFMRTSHRELMSYLEGMSEKIDNLQSTIGTQTERIERREERREEYGASIVSSG